MQHTGKVMGSQRVAKEQGKHSRARTVQTAEGKDKGLQCKGQCKRMKQGKEGRQCKTEKVFFFFGGGGGFRGNRVLHTLQCQAAAKPRDDPIPCSQASGHKPRHECSSVSKERCSRASTKEQLQPSINPTRKCSPATATVTGSHVHVLLLLCRV